VILFRGDRHPEARMYRTEGMLTRVMNGGNPATVSRVGLWEAARAHVQPSTASEEHFLAVTPFLSFSEIAERAGLYALGKEEKGILVPFAEPHGEDTIVFDLRTEGMVQDGHEGVFVLDYECDYGLAQPLGGEPDLLREAAAVSCEYCALNNASFVRSWGPNGRPLHRIQLIRVSTFLKGHSEWEQYDGARRQAEEDREWLVFPLDYIKRLKGFASRVPLSRVWSARRFTIVPA
jgi:hypothetical protein